jgi:hypothetical protein
MCSGSTGACCETHLRSTVGLRWIRKEMRFSSRSGGRMRELIEDAGDELAELLEEGLIVPILPAE